MHPLGFPTGAKVNDQSGLREGDKADGRKIAMFYSMEGVKLKEKIMKKVIKSWLKILNK